MAFKPTNITTLKNLRKYFIAEHLGYSQYFPSHIPKLAMLIRLDPSFQNKKEDTILEI